MALKVALLGCVGVVWLLRLGVQGADAGDGRKGMEPVPGERLIHLGGRCGSLCPLIHTNVNLTGAGSARSIFEFRTLDPEGLVFYGDTQGGADWFVLVLRGGVPEMQIKKADILSMVSGGPRLNDGKWHQLEVRSEGKIVVLEVDQQVALMVGLDSPMTRVQGDMTGQIRISLGMMLRQEKELFEPLVLAMDGCIRRGVWLNLSDPWVADLDPNAYSCFPDIQPGSYFSGEGLVVFNTSDSLSLPPPPFPSQSRDNIIVELEGHVEDWTGSFLNIQTQNHESLIIATVRNQTKQLEINVDTLTHIMPLVPGENSLTLNLSRHQIKVHYGTTDFTIKQTPPGDPRDWLAEWDKGLFLAFGGVMGGSLHSGSLHSGSDYLHGCIGKIKVQNQEVDLDRALYKHASVTSHSCPVSPL
nr:sex hormone-binding globulin-like isoform X2 [Paramormyrops kingsleyae]XP_023680440.1 sex hormone-binding globulin-like isoform X2 [Paramormyrops kingsleyae]